MVSTAQYFIPRLLGQFLQSYPDIEMSFDVLNRNGVIELLRNNKLDLAVMSVPPSDLDVESEIFLQNPLVPIGPRNGSLTHKKRISLREFSQTSLIMREQGSGTRLATERFFELHDLNPQIRLSLGSNEAIIQAVAGGMGYSIISTHALASLLTDSHIVKLKVDSFPIKSQWSIVTCRGKKLSPIATIFRDYLRNAAKELYKAS